MGVKRHFTKFVLAALFTFGLAASAQAQSCTAQCLTAQGKVTRAKFKTRSNDGRGCNFSGKKNAKSKCGGNGRVEYGHCYGNIMGNKVKESKTSNC